MTPPVATVTTPANGTVGSLPDRFPYNNNTPKSMTSRPRPTIRRLPIL